MYIRVYVLGRAIKGTRIIEKKSKESNPGTKARTGKRAHTPIQQKQN